MHKHLPTVTLIGMCMLLLGCAPRHEDEREPPTSSGQPAADTQELTEGQATTSPGVRLLAGSGDFTALPGLPKPSPWDPPKPEGDVVLFMSFDGSPEQEDVFFDTFAHADFKAETRVLTDPDTGIQNPAAFLGGAEGETHDWKPSLGWRFPPQSEGYLKITMDLYQASYEKGSFDFQLVDQRTGFDVHYTLLVHNDFIRVPYTPSRWFEDTITAGSDARWHRLTWLLPLPGSVKGPMELTLDDENKLTPARQHRATGAITGLRLYIFQNRNPEIAFYIDNLLIERFEAHPASLKPQEKMSFF